jgi:YD repeat-containing protein
MVLPFLTEYCDKQVFQGRECFMDFLSVFPFSKDEVMNKNYLKLLKCVVFLTSLIGFSAQTQTLKYTYDALGRVTFVEDTVNGNRDYDMDPAGNRLLVSVNTINDDAAKPGGLLAPTGLRVAGPYGANGTGWGFYWNAVAGATSYEGQLKDGTPFSTTRLEGSSAGPRPDWVRAKNSAGVGPAAYFP